MARKSSEFYRLEKDLGNGFKSVIEFHQVVNGNRYCSVLEEHPSSLPDGHPNVLHLNEYRFTSKDAGNNAYKRYKAEGYKFVGVYEMDIFGYKKLICSNSKVQ